MRRFMAHGLPLLLMLIAVGAAYWRAAELAEGVRWTYLFDALRDLGIAQSILDGDWPGDHVYRDEIQWYNPLMGFITAAASVLSDAPLHVVNAQVGLYFNLLMPICFYVLMAVYFGSWAALWGTAYLMFVPEMEGAMWPSGTYTPWLWAPHSTFFAFCLAMIMLHVAVRRDGWPWFALSGAFLGVTFMGHTAPAVLFGLITIVVSIWRTCSRAGGRPLWQRALRSTRDFSVIHMAALVVSSPYWAPIALRYQFHVVNQAPGTSVHYSISLRHLSMSAPEWISTGSGLALCGVVALFFWRTQGWAKAAVFTWLTVSLALLLNAVAVQWLRQNASYMGPGFQVVPGHHFALYLSYGKAVLVGLGIAGIAALAGRLVRSNGRWAVGFRWTWHAAVAGLAAAYFAQFALATPYRLSVTKQYDMGWPQPTFEHHEALYYWILDNTAPADIIASNEQTAMTVVNPAGRKTVSTHMLFSNIYVDHNNLTEQWRGFEQALRAKDERYLRELTQDSGAQYLILEGDSLEYMRLVQPGGWEERYRAGPLVVFAFDASGAATGADGNRPGRTIRNP